MGLLNLTGLDDRIYGGLGFMIQTPCTQVHAIPSSVWELVGEQLEPRAASDVSCIIDELKCLTPLAARIVIEDGPPSHSGFGSKTALLLSILKAVSSSLAIDLTQSAMMRLSGRGGTSGIGSWGFFQGGFLADSGRAVSEVKVPGPSASMTPVAPPALTMRIPFPEHWRILLVLPDGRRLTDRDEEAVFEAAYPLPVAETRLALAIAADEILPAIRSEDLSRLKTALLRFNRCGFKAREIAAQTAEVKYILQHIASCDFMAGGMSSMGPLLYAIVEESKVESVDSLMRATTHEMNAQLSWTTADNRGARLVGSSSTVVGFRPCDELEK